MYVYPSINNTTTSISVSMPKFKPSYNCTYHIISKVVYLLVYL